jgi:hypothetical protein
VNSNGVFEAFQARRVCTEEATDTAEPQCASEEEIVQEPDASASASRVDDVSAEVIETAVVPTASADAGPRFDEERYAADVREEAIRFATIATARALRSALRDATVLTHYVDDALRACGRPVSAAVRLHPGDAIAYRPQRGVRIAADASLDRGAIAVDFPDGTVGATVDERAALLVRAACA